MYSNAIDLTYYKRDDEVEQAILEGATVGPPNNITQEKGF